MKTGLFRGKINPVHEGHLRIAREVKTAFKLDRIHLIPSLLPPHKKPAGVVSAAYRLEMIRLALRDRMDLAVSEVELKRSGPSYTIDTVRYFITAQPGDATLYLIMGLDAFLEIDSWKSYKELFQLVPMIIMARPGKVGDIVHQKWKTVEDFLIKKISGDYVYSESKSSFTHTQKRPVYPFDVTLINISSSMIRKRVKAGRSIKGLVPDGVAEFIVDKGLYL